MKFIEIKVFFCKIVKTKTIFSDMQIHKDIILTSQHNQKRFGLDAFYQENTEQKPCIIFIHGFNGFKDWGHFDLLSKFFAEQGFVFVKFNLSHNGTSIENPTEFVDLEAYGHDYFTRDLDDIEQVIDYLHSENCPFQNQINLNKIFLIGHSRGGGLVILKTAEDTRIKGVCTWAAISNVHYFWTKERLEAIEKTGVYYYHNGRTKQDLPLYKAYYENVRENSERLNIPTKASSINVPFLITHGVADTSVPISMAEEISKNNPQAETFWIEDAMHTFGGSHPYNKTSLPEHAQTLCEKTADFFRKI